MGTADDQHLAFSSIQSRSLNSFCVCYSHWIHILLLVFHCTLLVPHGI